MDKRNSELEIMQTGIERMVLLFFSVFYVCYLSHALIAKWPPVFSFLLVFSAIINWLLHIKRVGDFKKRAFVNVFMMYFMLIGSFLCDSDVIALYIVFIAIVVTSGLYGFESLILLAAVFQTLLLLLGLLRVHNISVFLENELGKFLLPLTVMYFIEALLTFWMKKRSESQEKMQMVISTLAKAEHSNREFLMNVSGEIRQPVDQMREICEKLCDEDDMNFIQNQLLFMHAYGEDLVAFFDDVIDFSAVQSKWFAIENVEYQTRHMIRQIEERCLAIRGEKPIDIIFDIDASLPSVMYGDENRLSRAIGNAMNFAIHNTESGGVMLSVTRCKDVNGISLLITITDTSNGASQDVISQFRESFKQMKDTPEEKSDGNNLAMALSYIIILNMGGQFNIRSIPGQGNVINMVIPQVCVDEKQWIPTYHKKTICYIDNDRLQNTVLVDAYKTLCEHSSKQLDANIIYADSMTQFQRCLRDDDYDNVLISANEYKNYREYFERIARRHRLVVITEYYERELLGIRGIGTILNPFDIYNVVDKFNDDMIFEKADTPTVLETKTNEKPDKVEEPETIREAVDDKAWKIGNLDTELGMMYCGGEQSYRMILEDYANRGKKAWSLIQKLFDEQNWKEYTIEVHGIKSSMLTIGAKELSEKAKQLELAGKGDDIAYIQANHQEMLQDYQEVIRVLQDYFGIEEIENKESETPVELNELSVDELREISSAMEEAAFSLDNDAMHSCVERLQKGSYQGKDFISLCEEVLRKIKKEDYLSAMDLVQKNIEECQAK